MLPALSDPSREEWQKYERRSMAKQQEFIERYRDDFDKVPITNSDSIKAGDHLVFERNYYLLHYDHHMLCTFSGDNHVLVIHYTAPSLGASRGLRSISFKDVGIKVEVKETMFSFEELLKQQVCIKETTLMQKSLPPTMLLAKLKIVSSFLWCLKSQINLRLRLKKEIKINLYQLIF